MAQMIGIQVTALDGTQETKKFRALDSALDFVAKLTQPRFASVAGNEVVLPDGRKVVSDCIQFTDHWTPVVPAPVHVQTATVVHLAAMPVMETVIDILRDLNGSATGATVRKELQTKMERTYSSTRIVHILKALVKKGLVEKTGSEWFLRNRE